VDTGTSATIGLAAQSAGGAVGTAQASMSSTEPAGLPVLQSVARRAQGSRGPQDEVDPIVGILYFGFSASAPPQVTGFTFPQEPTFTITLPSTFFSVPSTTFYLALYDPSRPALGWQSRAETCVATATTSTLTCNQTPASPVTILNNVTYSLALYAISTNAASPTPGPAVSPTAVATNSPTPATGAASGTVAIATGATLTLPAASGVSGSLVLGAASTSTTAAVTLFLALPPGLPTPTTQYPAPFYYVFTPAASVTITGTTTGTFTPPTGYTGVNGNAIYPYVEVYDSSNPTYGWVPKVAGPGTDSPSGLTMISTTQTIVLTGGVQYAFAVYPSQ
jgi:hypothetical protein